MKLVSNFHNITVIRNLFCRISQLELKQQIDSLNEELQKVREALNNHPDLDPYVKKLIACKHKVTVVLNVLQASQVSQIISYNHQLVPIKKNMISTFINMQ